jgi:hypothetical protein
MHRSQMTETVIVYDMEYQNTDQLNKRCTLPIILKISQLITFIRLDLDVSMLVRSKPSSAVIRFFVFVSTSHASSIQSTKRFNCTEMVPLCRLIFQCDDGEDMGYGHR